MQKTPESNSNELLRISVAQGKYTVVQEQGGRVDVLRYGEEWEGGHLYRYSGLVLAMAQEIETLRKELANVTDQQQ